MVRLGLCVPHGVTDNVDFDMSGLDDMNSGVIREFRETGGTAGGLVEGMPLVLVHHVGAKSGTARIAPLVPFVEDGRVYVFASLGGADIHPAWYHNLLAHPETVIELGDETVAVTARVLTGDERDAIYAKQSAVQPQFADYQRKTSRVIPVVELVRSAG